MEDNNYLIDLILELLDSSNKKITKETLIDYIDYKEKICLSNKEMGDLIDFLVREGKVSVIKNCIELNPPARRSL